MKSLTRSLTVAAIFILGIVCSIHSAQAQIEISGKVVSSKDGMGIPGVTIQIKGTNNGTVTDFDGNFSVEVSEGEVLVISSIGFKTQEIVTGALSTIDITLEEDVEELDELVVIGYGQVEEKDVTGVVNKIDEKTFNKGVLASPDMLINGKVAGVSMVNSGGEPGAQVNIRIRGGTSLSASNQPLFVIDGIPIDSEPNNPTGMSGARNPLNFINPNDIADITILKDASAAAIYGSRGANGVIIITSKSGSKGGLELTYDVNLSLTSFTNPGLFLGTEDFINVIGTQASSKLGDLGEANTDWVGEITRTAQSMNHNLNASFGNTQRQVRVSLNYQNLNGLLETSNSERLAGSINFAQNFFNDRLKLTLNSKHSKNNDRFAPRVLNTAFSFDPTQSVFADNPEFGGYFEHENILAPTNPVSALEQTFDIGESTRNLVSLKVDYKLPFINGLSVNTNTALDITNEKRQLYQPETLKSNSNPNGEFIYADNFTRSDLAEVYLNYSKLYSSQQLSLDLTSGYSFQEWRKTRPVDMLVDDVDASTLGIDPMKVLSDSEYDGIVDQMDQANFVFDNRLISFWGRVNLSLQDKYIFTATYRRDGSTRFASTNQWGNFPSLAIGWRLLEESFASGLKSTFSDLKLRYSWGITGSQEIGDYKYVTTYEFSRTGASTILGNDIITGLRPTAVDPNIKWEETTSTNLGMDFGLLEGRLYGSVDYYTKNTNDLLLIIPVSAGSQTGDEVLRNVGAVQNRGLELQLNAAVIDRGDFSIDLNFNASTNKNEVTKITEGDGQLLRGGIAGAGFGGTIQVLREGAPAYSFFVYEHKRDASGRPFNDMADHNGDGLTNLLDMYVDQPTIDTDGDGIFDSGDGIINENDKAIKGKPWADWTLGFTSNFRYKKFDLAMTFRAQLGAETYNNAASFLGAYSIADGIAPTNIHRAAVENDFNEEQVFSEIFVENADFLRLDNISLGYNHTVSDKLNVRGYVTVSNVFLLTGYSGVDPEAGPSPSASQEGRNSFGIDNNLYPRGRTFL